MSARRSTRRGMAVAALVVSLTLSVGLAEAALRILAPQPPSWLAIYRRHPELPFHALLPNAATSVDTGETRWRVVTDGAGHRVGERRGRETECAAVWLGDSFAFGHGVDYEESFIGLVQERSPEVRHVNTSVPGYGPTQYREVLEHLLARGERFDVVFVATFVGNDFHDTVWTKDVEVHAGVVGHRRDLRSYLKTHVQLYRLVSAAYHRLVGKPANRRFQETREQIADVDAWDRGFLAGANETFAREMAHIQQLGREYDAEVRFVVLPTRDAVAVARGESVQDVPGDPSLPVSKAIASLAAIGVEVLDLTSALAGASEQNLYLPFDGHLTRAGNRIVADALVEAWPRSCPTSRGAP